MTASLSVASADGRSSAVGQSAAILRRVLVPKTNIVVWRRRFDPNFSAYLERCAAFGWSVERVVEGEPGPLDFLVTLLDPGPDRDRLLADVAARVEQFRALCRPRRFHLHLGVVTRNQCAKFHVDFIKMRLLCTYWGPGTEWVENDVVDRGCLCHPSDPDDANARIVRNLRAVRRSEAGDVMLLKGETWPGNANRGAVHRSPPVEATGARRLVLSLTARASDPLA